jgi:hypothetical protein
VSQPLPSYLLPSSLDPELHLDPSSSSYLQWINAPDQRPKHTAAHSRSSHLPLPLLEAIECAVTTIETPVPSCTSSYRRRHLETAGSSPKFDLYAPSPEISPET